MNSHTTKLLLLFSLLSVGGCKKADQPMDNSAIVGNWTWVESGFSGSDAYLVTANSGVKKNLTFLADGTLYVVHNDSSGTHAVLDVYDLPVLLGKMVVDTEKFQLGDVSGGCVIDKYPAVIVTGKTTDAYQYTIAGDTLQISPGPCLAPFTTYYVRN